METGGVRGTLSRSVLAPAAVGGLVPAVLVLTGCVIVATDGSNDRHRDFSDFLRGVAFGVPVAVVMWALASAFLAVLLFASSRTSTRASSDTEHGGR